MRSSVIFLLVAGTSLLVAPAVQAQSRTQARRDFVEGVLRTLIESNTRQTPSPRPQPRPSQISPKLSSARQLLQGFSQESNNLLTSLRNEERYSSAIRPLLGDALRVKAASDVLLQKAHYVRDEKELLVDAQSLDQQWRVLAHRLSQVPDLGATCLTHVRRLSDYDQQLCQLLQIAPQLDRGELIGLAIAMSTNLKNLLEDITLDLPNDQTRNSLLMEGRKLQLQVDQIADAIGQDAHPDELVALYKANYDLWRPLAAKLRPIESESLSRNLHRIDQLHRYVHELLWLDQSLDRSAVVYFAQTIQRDVDRLYADISLAELVALSKPEETTSGMIEFQGLCQNFSRLAANNAPLDDLLWDFRLLEVEWQQTQAQFQSLGTPAVAQHLSEIEGNVLALGDSLNIRQIPDQQTAASLAASIDESAVLLDKNLRQHLARYSQSSQFRSQLLNFSHDFHESAHGLHERLVRGEREDVLRRECVAMAEKWNLLVTHIARLQYKNDAGLVQPQEQIVPQLVKLQVLLAY